MKVIDCSVERKPKYRMRYLSFGGKVPPPKKTWEEIRAIIYEGRGE